MEQHTIIVLMFSLLIIIPFVVSSPVLFNDVAQLSDNTNNNNHKLIGQFIALGSVDGKTYIMNNLTMYSWNMAKDYCEQSAMKLASITSEAQRDFLISKYHLLKANPMYLPLKYYWTAGRDAMNPTQFRWDHNATSPIHTTYFESDGIRSALVYFPITSSSCSLLSKSIIEPHHVICEI